VTTVIVASVTREPKTFHQNVNHGITHSPADKISRYRYRLKKTYEKGKKIRNTLRKELTWRNEIHDSLENNKIWEFLSSTFFTPPTLKQL
jgi:hypothetical protein